MDSLHVWQIFKVMVNFKEFEVDKMLGIRGPQDVLEMGIDKYNNECRKIVMRYSSEWEVIHSFYSLQFICHDDVHRIVQPSLTEMRNQRCIQLKSLFDERANESTIINCSIWYQLINAVCRLCHWLRVFVYRNTFDLHLCFRCCSYLLISKQRESDCFCRRRWNAWVGGSTFVTTTRLFIRGSWRVFGGHSVSFSKRVSSIVALRFCNIFNSLFPF